MQTVAYAESWGTSYPMSAAQMPGLTAAVTKRPNGLNFAFSSLTRLTKFALKWFLIRYRPKNKTVSIPCQREFHRIVQETPSQYRRRWSCKRERNWTGGQRIELLAPGLCKCWRIRWISRSTLLRRPGCEEQDSLSGGRWTSWIHLHKMARTY